MQIFHKESSIAFLRLLSFLCFLLFQLESSFLSNSQCIYQIIWDIYIDWSLGNKNSKNKFLRDKLVYKKNFYYFAIISNIIARILWVWHYAKLKEKYEEWKILFLTLLEIARRTQWCIIRIENEETTNPEMYRTILAIPQLPEVNENEQFF